MRKIFAFASGVLLIAVFLAFPSNQTLAAEQPRYGYSLLTTDVQRIVYQEILDGAKVLAPQITLSVHATDSTVQSVFNDTQHAINMVVKDYPELIWFAGAYDISGNGTTDDVTFVVSLQYTLNGQSVSAGSQITNAQNRLDQAVTAALATVPRNASDYDTALALHDYIIDHVTYVHEGDHQTAYGALVNGKAVCAGYARAYQLLMLKAGISCTYITGKSNDPKTGNLVNHAWNLVWLDGKCYYTDVTWNDQGVNGVFHEYLNLSKEEIGLTHFLDDGEILPASCGHDNYRFFIKNSGKGVCDIKDHKEDSDVAECFQVKSLNGRDAQYYCTIHYHKDDFSAWLDAHHETIGEKLGFESFSVETVSLGHEHHVLFSGTLLDSASAPSVTPTESQPIQQSSEPTQQTQSSQQPTQSQATESIQNQNPTQTTTTPTEQILPTSPTDATAPVEPTSASQAGTEPSESQQPTQTNSISDSENSNTTDSEEPKENHFLVIGISFGIVLIGGGAATFVLIKKRR